MSRFSAIATLGVLVTYTAGASVRRRWDSATPFFEADPGAPSGCSLWWNTDDGLPCDVALNIAGATEADLIRLVCFHSHYLRTAVMKALGHSNNSNSTS